MRHRVAICKRIPARAKLAPDYFFRERALAATPANMGASNNWSMKKKTDAGLLSKLLTNSARSGFMRAYQQIRINDRRYMRHLQRAYRLPINSWDDMFHLGPGVLNPIANSTILASSRFAALEGVGLGFGGLFTAVPDLGILAAITLRLLQKLSLLYGFEYATEEEAVGLWIAAASAAGVDLGRDFLQKQAVDKIVPRVIDQMAVKVGADVAEKWVGRIVPVLSAGAAGAINYYFVRSWGRRAQKHFIGRHNLVAGRGLPSGYPAPRALAPAISTSTRSARNGVVIALSAPNKFLQAPHDPNSQA